MSETEFDINDRALRTQFSSIYNTLIQNPMTAEQINQLKEIKLQNLDYLEE